MLLQDFDYSLPEALIAQFPAERRDDSRLLRISPGDLIHGHFADLPGLLRPGDLLVLNDTRVIKARLLAEKDTGGQAEVLVERIESSRQALCQVRVSKPLKAGRFLEVGGLLVQILGREGEFYRLAFPEPVLTVLDDVGQVPLPPYIRRPDDAADQVRYQTVYGVIPGAVAAPTAGLHFTQEMLDAIAGTGVNIAYVTLHVGAGTFQPVRVDNLSEHVMHSERITVSQVTADAINACTGRVVAVGTTVVRALESAVVGGRVTATNAETELFITPGYRFQVVDCLVTNFHVPKSTLLMLVCAFGGHERVMRAYAEAVGEGYRFFSYGDACFIERPVGHLP
jgi:S-adenosylmethionine:tRNA ribosyltransferase-isomerase